MGFSERVWKRPGFEAHATYVHAIVRDCESGVRKRKERETINGALHVAGGVRRVGRLATKSSQRCFRSARTRKTETKCTLVMARIDANLRVS